ncbi:HEAT repeat domain-containing protein [Flavobacterium sp. NRK1]|uniref:HEAT repeat domain-containing protein n=1 Tax=Flavobacterium sp. NRK1 TaxID=2954929 RepID=UPI0020926E9A|nr:hypothetical protein [Flavobacterium sp. NRK1]MCO6149196.1 hypothetical protein [Flavobacterium sp. NRK1]
MAILIFCLVFFIFYLRIYKNYRSQNKKIYENLFIDFINVYLFSPDFKESQLTEFKNTYLETGLQKAIAIKVILIYNQNFKGESNTALKKLFFLLGLENVVLRDLKNKKWYKRARAVYVLSNLKIKADERIMISLLNDKKVEIRLQTVLYFIKLSEKDPLNFLYKLQEPLTIWQQIHISAALKNYEGEIPDFSQWLTHEQESVVTFSMKMIAEYGQFENIPKVIPFFNSLNDEIKKEAIICLRKLGYEETVDLSIADFSSSSITVKKEILKVIKELGDYKKLMLLLPSVTNDDIEVKTEFLRVEQYFLK